MVFLIFLLASYTTLVASSSIYVDFSSSVFVQSQAYIIEYSPPVGYPPSGSSIDGSTYYTEINGTISATEYVVHVSAISMNGLRQNLTQFSVFSSPDPPTLDSIETTEHEATISYFPPQGQNISYNLEYYPEGHKEYANSIDTKASLVRLRGLDSGTAFRIRIRSVFMGVHSEKIIDTVFNTQGNAVYDYSSSSESGFSVATLPPNINFASKTIRTETSSTEATSLATIRMVMGAPNGIQSIDYEDNGGEDDDEDIDDTEEEEEVTKQMIANTTPTPFVIITSLPTSTTTIRSTTYETTPTPTTTTTTSTTTETIVPKKAEVVNSGDLGDDQPSETHGSLIPLEKMVAEYGEPSVVWIGDSSGALRLEWDAPDNAACDAFFVNYTILTLNRPKSFSLATSDENTNIKFFAEHTLDIRVFCMIAGALSKTWWAHRIADLSKPKPLENFRIVNSTTDEFYASSLEVAWDWPSEHDFNLYKIVISYGLDLTNTQDIEIQSKQDKILIDKLEAATNYVITARNASTELSLRSKSSTVEQITPPIISSQVYPGEISSNSININFDESDPQQGRFDYYLLTFSGNSKNISKRVDIDHEKSFTFTKLIPGKTYTFDVYTVYKGIKSRPVTAEITTYPLKVNKLFPVVGKDYVVLYWDIENFADSDCRFRLSYNAENVPPVSVELKGASRHRFVGLHPTVYYTFTITVIMGVGKSAAESESEMVTVAMPKSKTPGPTVQRQGSRELVVSFDRDQPAFTELNGAPDNFAVIVSDDTSLNDDNYELKSWFEVKDEDVWGSFRASPSTWNPFETERQRHAAFTIGTDDCVRRSLDEPYCNGILRANTDYRVKIRMYTNTMIAMETEWARIEGAADEKSGDDEEEEDDESNDRRFPCHMYLNGCRKKKKSSTNVSPFISLVIIILYFI